MKIITDRNTAIYRPIVYSENEKRADIRVGWETGVEWDIGDR